MQNEAPQIGIFKKKKCLMNSLHINTIKCKKLAKTVLDQKKLSVEFIAVIIILSCADSRFTHTLNH